MTIFIQQNESAQTLRIVPIWCVTSNGTTPAASEAGGQPGFYVGGIFKGNTGATLSAVSAAAGEYYVALSQSNVSVLGTGRVVFASATALATSNEFQVVAFNPFKDQPIVSNLTLVSGTSFGLNLSSQETNTNDALNGAFIAVQYPSGLWVGNIISDYTGSNTSAWLKNALPATTASGMTYVIFPGTPETDLSTATIGSTLTVWGIPASAGTQILQSHMSYDMGGGRLVQEAWDAIRNKVDATSSVLTVYRPDDTTSSWTGTVSTGGSPINKIDPLG